MTRCYQYLDRPVTSPLTEDEKEHWRKQFANAGK